jgi:hypothetical protein
MGLIEQIYKSACTKNNDLDLKITKEFENLAICLRVTCDMGSEEEINEIIHGSCAALHKMIWPMHNVNGKMKYIHVHSLNPDDSFKFGLCGNHDQNFRLARMYEQFINIANKHPEMHGSVFADDSDE